MHPLDNPIWESLSTRRSCFAQGDGTAQRFHPDVTSLAGFPAPTESAYASLAALFADGRPAALFLPEKREPPSGWHTVLAVPLLQMVLDASQNIPAASEAEELTAADVPEMLALAKLTQPGPFGTRTLEMENYVAIRREGNIVAMAGERIRVEGYGEISAVCTHPRYAGRGLARGLVGLVAERIRARGETPCLHVGGTNTRAIELYKHLGFRTRLELYALVLRRPIADRPPSF